MTKDVQDILILVEKAVELHDRQLLLDAVNQADVSFKKAKEKGDTKSMKQLTMLMMAINESLP